MSRAHSKSLTLIELLIALALMSTIILYFFSYHQFSLLEVRASERRIRVHNDLQITIEHITKNLLQATTRWAPISPPIINLGNGFRVWIDRSITPDDPTDDVSADYLLDNATNTLICDLDDLVLSRRIRDNVVFGPIPEPLPVDPAGIYWSLSAGGRVMDILLVGRFFPDQPEDAHNPQEVMRTRIDVLNSAVN